MRTGKKKKSMPARFFLLVVKVIIIMVIAVMGIDIFVVETTEDMIAAKAGPDDQVLSQDEMEEMRSHGAGCILVLGASVKADGTPNDMLRDRLDLAVELYRGGAAPKLLLSGDHGQVYYDEVDAMKKYALAEGIPEDDIILDHEGFSTYDSVYRAATVFEADRVIVVTQTYHLHRALYGCRRMGIEAAGAASDQHLYGGEDRRTMREILARDKDFIKWIFKPEPTFMSDERGVDEDGEL